MSAACTSGASSRCACCSASPQQSGEQVWPRRPHDTICGVLLTPARPRSHRRRAGSPRAALRTRRPARADRARHVRHAPRRAELRLSLIHI
eukprot:3198091-Prymnesium_polylepis.1